MNLEQQILERDERRREKKRQVQEKIIETKEAKVYSEKRQEVKNFLKDPIETLTKWYCNGEEFNESQVKYRFYSFLIEALKVTK